MSTARTQWNPRTHEDFDNLKGMDVYTNDDEKIGSIEEVLHPADDSTDPDAHYFRVDPGFFEKLAGEDEVYVRGSMIEFVSEDRVILETPVSRVEGTDWSAPENVHTYRRY